MHADRAVLTETIADDTIRPSVIPFILFHVATLGIIWTGFTTEAVVMCVVLYVARVFGITGGFHRCLSHRSYKTGRVYAIHHCPVWHHGHAARPLWWAAKHREHHRDSDLPADAHSPRHYGFWGAHVGWVFRKRMKADYVADPGFRQVPGTGLART